MFIADSSASTSDDFKYKSARNENLRKDGLQSASRFLGLAYVFAYLGFVLLVPILLLAAAMLAGWKRFLRSAESAAAKVQERRLNDRASWGTLWA